VDFRELVKDLASQFRTRIELRQIGVRDEAKMLGGLGSCGRVVCCKQFLDDFHPVSIKMAKEQNLSLSPTKISGLCGRLMCCLQYEQSCYEDMKRRMPHVNRDILTPDGIGIVVDNNVITEKTKVRVTLPDGSIDLREFHYTLLAKPGEPLPVQPQQAAQPAEAPQSAQPAPRQERETAEVKPAAEGSVTQERNPDHKRRRRGGRGKERRDRAEHRRKLAEAQQPNAQSKSRVLPDSSNRVLPDSNSSSPDATTSNREQISQGHSNRTQTRNSRATKRRGKGTHGREAHE
jgi:hypothetical protein